MINVLDKGYVRHVDTLGSDLSVVNAARVSFDKESQEFNEKDEKLLAFLLREKHTAPFRHAAMTFEIYAPLMVARQWWKYAVASTHVDDQNGWNESSRRYVTEEPTFYVPEIDKWRTAPENKKQGSGESLSVSKGDQWTQRLETYLASGTWLYEKAISEGIAPEQARLFLPAYGMYVRWRWTISLQGILHFIDERLGHDAQAEIQQYARAIYKLTEKEFPVTIKAWSTNS